MPLRQFGCIQAVYWECVGTYAWQCCSGMDSWYSPNWANDHDNKAMDAPVLGHTMQEWKLEHAKLGQTRSRTMPRHDHRTATAQGYALVTQLHRGLVGLLDVRILLAFSQEIFFHILPRDNNNRYLRETKEVPTAQGKGVAGYSLS